MHGITNWSAGLCIYAWSLASNSLRVWHGQAMRESIHALCASKVRGVGRSSWDKPAWLCILAFSRVFTVYLSNTVVSGKSPNYFWGSRIVLKLLVSLIGHLIACNARISVDRQTDTLTDRTTAVTLAAHVRRGLTSQYECTEWQSTAI